LGPEPQPESCLRYDVSYGDEFLVLEELGEGLNVDEEIAVRSG
jgi:hypothetical protein